MRGGNKAHELVFVGAAGGMERGLARESGLDFAAYHELQAGPIHGVNPFRMLLSLVKLGIGSLQAMFKLASIKPAVVLLTGGWANLPVAVGARLLRIPIVIYLPDIEPGLTIKALRHFATRVALTVADSAQFFPGQETVVTGYPLRQDRLDARRDRALAHFQLDPARKTLLVFGGSQGARSINIALAGILPELLDQGLQILHITGQLDWGRHLDQLGDLKTRAGYQAFPYLHEDMGLAFAAADLAVCRAGASCLAELPLFGLPAILTPYPHAWRYQRVNADYLSDRGAALRLNDDQLPTKLLDAVTSLIGDERRLAAMSAKSKALANPDGAGNLARLLLAIGGE